MSKLKKILPLLLVATLVLAGCGGTKETSNAFTEESSIESEAPVTEEEPPTEEEPIGEESNESQEEPVALAESSGSQTENFIKNLETLEKDAYEGLEITAAILEKKAILPGLPVNVHVTVKNTGDKTVTFQHGSSKATLPDAILVYSDHLQPLLPKEDLGPMTMDMMHTTLAPGEEKIFVYPLLAIEPNDNFDTYTFDVYADEKEPDYIGELGPDGLTERFDDIVLTSPGTYTGYAVICYSLDDSNDATGNPTAYNQTEFSITVTD